MDIIEPTPVEEPVPDLPAKAASIAGTPALVIEPGKFEIAGIWRRVLAVIIDIVLLAIPFVLLGFIFRDQAFAIGPYGRLIGYSVLVLYWGLRNSRLYHGQTLGKKIMRTAVVDGAGNYLSVKKAFLRASIITIISLFNQWPVPILQNPLIGIIFFTIVFGGGAALIYGLIFNRRTRQGIHDLIVGSYVVKAPPVEGVNAPEIPRVHKIISFGLVGLALGLGCASFIFKSSNSSLGILQPGEWQDIQTIQSTLMQTGEFFTVSVVRNNRAQFGSSQTSRDLNIQVWVKTNCTSHPDYCEKLMKRIALLAFEKYRGIADLTGMRIAVINAFDLGLASGKVTKNWAWTIADWRKQLQGQFYQEQF